jgi:hypothetical protein
MMRLKSKVVLGSGVIPKHVLYCIVLESMLLAASSWLWERAGYDCADGAAATVADA